MARYEDMDWPVRSGLTPDRAHGESVRRKLDRINDSVVNLTYVVVGFCGIVSFLFGWYL